MRTKTLLITLSLILVILASACSAVQAAPPLQNAEPQDSVRSLSVSGTGRVTLTPDIARISIGVQTESADAQEALADNNDRAQDVIDTLLDYGIQENDIRTTNFSIYPRQDYDRDGNPLEIRYIVQNTVLVTIRDLTLVGEVLDETVQVGANSIMGIQFDVADRASAEAEGLEAAVVDARNRAEVLARAADIELGAVQSINTVVAGVFPQPIVGRGFEVAEAASVPISAGEMEITVDVTVVYAIQ